LRFQSSSKSPHKLITSPRTPDKHLSLAGLPAYKYFPFPPKR